jgi:glucose/arabinose dehydrogenase
MKIFSVVYITSLMLLISCRIDNTNTKNPDNNFPDTASVIGKYQLQEALPGVTFNLPVELTSPDDGSDRVFVLEQAGKIKVAHTSGNAITSMFLDITNKVESGGEKGLLGLAFHPDYKTNGYFYVNYTRGNPLQTLIARYKASTANPDVADPASEQILLTYSQPYSNHNGGKVAFGNDGYLYIAAGDGGSGGDPENRAQNRKELLGKILRIDVNHSSSNLSYSIPADNPYRNNTLGYREEIYAYGLRNPWRFSFHRLTGSLWAGDVGQNRVEEVDIIEKGGNYGWRITEANECYGSNSCDKAGLIAPVWSYNQGTETGRSVTGGYVCEDKNLPGLKGKYIYGDYVSGNIWALTLSGKIAVKNELLTTLSGGLSSFGEDNKNNLYALAYGSGKIYKLTPKD